MPVGLMNAHVAFQAHPNHYLQLHIDDSAVSYLDNISIYLTKEEEYKE